MISVFAPVADTMIWASPFHLPLTVVLFGGKVKINKRGGRSLLLSRLRKHGELMEATDICSDAERDKAQTFFFFFFPAATKNA